jgi:putative tryptophan/tyrosine transport system substrate-binding protein
MMIGPRALFLVLAVCLLASPSAAHAQPQTRTFRVGLLLVSPPAALMETFRQVLHDLGYVEGRNLVIVTREARGSPDLLPALAAELVQANVDVIFAPSTTPARAARQATNSIPIVFATAADPVGTGLVASLRRPGGNVTGISSIGGDLAAKRLELLRELVPGLSRVAFIWRDAPAGRVELRETEAAARAMGVTIYTAMIRSADDLERAFTEAVRARVQAAIVPRNPITFEHSRRVAELAVRSRLPSVYDDAEFAEAGGLLTYGPSLRQSYRRAAVFVDKILKGTKPADLPVEQPTEFELIVNVKTARALGLAIPPPLLLRANQVIE